MNCPMYSSMKNNYGCFIVPLDVIHLTFMALDNIGKNIEYVSEVGLPQGSWGGGHFLWPQ